MILRMNEKECEEEITSSKCSSGWTMYLDHSYEKPSSVSISRRISMHQYHQQQEDDEEEDSYEKPSSVSISRRISMHQYHQQQEDDEEEEEEEDLSMVSDASSGPPHFNDDKDDQHCYNEHGKKRRVEKKMQITELELSHSSLLDDTASSLFFSFSKTSCNGTTTNNKRKLLVEDVLDLSCGFSVT